MRVTHISLRDFRCYTRAEVELGERLTIVHGRNGAGKTNLLEGLYLGCTGRSCRTTNERELVRFGEPVARVDLRAEGEDGPHQLSVGLEPGAAKRVRADGVAVERLTGVATRPLAGVFLPDRLELVKGAPSVRRAHLDQVVAALWPARTTARRAYARALAQRNALLSRVRAGAALREALAPWDRTLAVPGIELMGDRAAAVDALVPHFEALAAELALDGAPSLAYRPRSRATTPEELEAELRERLDSDLERGFSAHGPHRDDLALRRDGRELRAYGSQGQQRLALLALLLAERAAIAQTRGAPPLMLLDDVMSELDADRRERLVALLAEDGQSLITTTDLAHVPVPAGVPVTRILVADGAVLGAVPDAPEEAAA